MDNNAASIKSTSGDGFSYETFVGSIFAAAMLGGESVDGTIQGMITSISFQNKAIRWIIDDLLVTTRAGAEHYQYALSIKDNRQISSSGFPKEFITQCWKQFSDPSASNPFDRQSDFLGLVFSTISPDVFADVQEFLRQARNQPADKFLQSSTAENIGNDNKRALLESVQSNIENKDFVHALICRLLPLHFEDNIENGLTLCRKLLRSSADGAALKLWSRITSIVDDLRTSGGAITVTELADRLKKEFLLMEYPYYESDYEKLKANSGFSITRTRDLIGRDLKLDRSPEVAKVIALLEGSKHLILHGESGTGKSGLLKNIANSEVEDHFVLWFNARDLATRNLVEVERTINLQYPLSELLANVRDPKPLLILDGIAPGITREVVDNIKGLLSSCNSVDNELQWRIIIGSQTASLSEVLKIASQAGIDKLSDYLISEPDLTPLLKRFPKLAASIEQRPGLLRVLNNLQYADIIATITENATANSDREWVSESQIITAFWDDIIVGNDTNGMKRTLWEMATVLADTLNYDISLANISDSKQISNLKAIGVLDSNGSDRLFFKHDLFADWTRTRHLCSLTAVEIVTFVDEKKRLLNPLWRRTLAFYFTTEIEKQSSDWVHTFELLLAANSDTPLLWQVISNAIAHSEGAEKNLEVFFSKYLDANIENLRSFLNGFIYSTTTPDLYVISWVLKTFPNEATENQLKKLARRPIVQLWVPFLKVILKRPTLLFGCPNEMIQICNYWIVRAEENRPFLTELCEFTIQLSEAFFAKDDRIANWPKVIDKKIFALFLLATSHFPKEVRELLMKICKRSESTSPRVKRKVITSMPGLPFSAGLGLGSADVALMWPHGPKESIDSPYQDILLDGATLLPVIRAIPDTAVEAILALLISPPQPHYYASQLGEIHGMERVRVLQIPIYDRGPFLPFLGSNPMKGLELIVKLVNFCTERKYERNNASISVTINGKEAEWHGDLRTVYWHRNSHPNSMSVVIALMALEYHLYSLIDEGKDYKSILNYIYENSRSAAFLGVFLSVGKKYPEKLLEDFKYLLEIPELYVFDNIRIFREERHATLGNWMDASESDFNTARVWNAMPHRKTDLMSLAFQHFVNELAWKEAFEGIRKKWLAEAQKYTELVGDEYFQTLVHTFDDKSLERHQKGDAVYIEPVLPEELAQARKKNYVGAHRRMLTLSFPARCRELLEGDSELSDDQFDEMWSQLQLVIDPDDLETDETGLLDPFNSIAGFLALLSHAKNSKYLVQEDVKEWFDEFLIEALQIVFSTEDDNYFYDDSTWTADAFLADIITHLYFDVRYAKLVRKAICRMILVGRPAVIELLFSNLIKLPSLPKGEYFEYLNLLILKSILFWNSIKHPGRSKEIKASYEAQIVELSESFLGGKVSHDKPILRKIFNECFPESKESPLNDTRSGKVFFSAFYFSGISSLPVSNGGDIDPDFESILIENFDTMIHMNGVVSEEDSRSHMPDDWDRWVLDNVVKTISHEEEDLEKSQALWVRIFELVDEDYYYVREFLRAWFTYNSNRPELRSIFDKNWDRMFKYASLSDKWKPSRLPYFPHLSDRSNALIGMFSLSHFSEFMKVDGTMRPSAQNLLTWAGINVEKKGSLLGFVAYLSKDSRQDVILKALPLIEHQLRDKSISSDLETWLVLLLEQIKEKHFYILRSDAIAMDAFNILLSQLVGTGNASAIHLAGEM